MKSVHSLNRCISRKFILSLIIFKVICLLTFPSFGQSDPVAFIHKLQLKYKSARSDSLKIEALSELSYYCYDYLGEKQHADSISRLAIDLAEASYRPNLLLIAYNRYLECNDLGLFAERALCFAKEATRLCKQSGIPVMEWRCTSNLVEVYLSSYRYDNALGSSYQALAIADAMGSVELKVKSYLLIGRSLEGNNQKVEAFRNYLNASAIAETFKNPGLLIKCYSQLSNFYNFSKLFEKKRGCFHRSTKYLGNFTDRHPLI